MRWLYVNVIFKWFIPVSNRHHSVESVTVIKSHSGDVRSVSKYLCALDLNCVKKYLLDFLIEKAKHITSD